MFVKSIGGQIVKIFFPVTYSCLQNTVDISGLTDTAFALELLEATVQKVKVMHNIVNVHSPH